MFGIYLQQHTILSVHSSPLHFNPDICAVVWFHRRKPYDLKIYDVSYGSFELPKSILHYVEYTTYYLIYMT